MNSVYYTLMSVRMAVVAFSMWLQMMGLLADMVLTLSKDLHDELSLLFEIWPVVFVARVTLLMALTFHGLS